MFFKILNINKIINIKLKTKIYIIYKYYFKF